MILAHPVFIPVPGPEQKTDFIRSVVTARKSSQGTKVNLDTRPEPARERIGYDPAEGMFTRIVKAAGGLFDSEMDVFINARIDPVFHGIVASQLMMIVPFAGSYDLPVLTQFYYRSRV